MFGFLLNLQDFFKSAYITISHLLFFSVFNPILILNSDLNLKMQCRFRLGNVFMYTDEDLYDPKKIV